MTTSSYLRVRGVLMGTAATLSAAVAPKQKKKLGGVLRVWVLKASFSKGVFIAGEIEPTGQA